MQTNQIISKVLTVGISIIAVVLLILTSLTNVIGYQIVQTSTQSVMEERINQKELLFQTIVDIANNKEIQRIILKSQMSRGIFPTSEFPVVTKNQLRQMYLIGLILSKVISKSRIQSMIGKYQFNNLEMQKEINSVIGKDSTLNTEITKLQDSDCDCDNGNTLVWRFPITCSVVYTIFWLLNIILERFFYGGVNNQGIGGMIFFGVFFSALMLNCQWAWDLWPDQIPDIK
jgi:hypothetical protein